MNVKKMPKASRKMGLADEVTVGVGNVGGIHNKLVSENLNNSRSWTVTNAKINKLGRMTIK